eukprot:3644242-Prymnesium_polylepis.1
MPPSRRQPKKRTSKKRTWGPPAMKRMTLLLHPRPQGKILRDNGAQAQHGRVRRRAVPNRSVLAEASGASGVDGTAGGDAETPCPMPVTTLMIRVGNSA